MIPPEWEHLPFFSTDWPRIEAAINADPRIILPPAAQRFAALNLTPPAAVRVVILGQDPYPTPGHAMGLAFSVPPDTRPVPRSLLNIFKELKSDLDVVPEHGDLTHWARQGVLLLNTALSVPAHKAGGHDRLGWDRLTAQIITLVSRGSTAFLLWGNHAQGFAPHIRPGDHLILTAAHPSPLSASRGFFSSKPFSKTNNWLTERGQPPINWATMPR